MMSTWTISDGTGETVATVEAPATARPVAVCHAAGISGAHPEDDQWYGTLPEANQPGHWAGRIYEPEVPLLGGRPIGITMRQVTDLLVLVADPMPV